MPTRAYFGEKDYQQLAIIHALVQQKNFPLRCRLPHSTWKRRFSHELAQSSFKQKTKSNRPTNIFVTDASRRKKQTHSIEEINRWVTAFFEQQAEFELDYFCIADARSLQPLRDKNTAQNARAFIAVKMGEIRLIDNVKF